MTKIDLIFLWETFIWQAGKGVREGCVSCSSEACFRGLLDWNISYRKWRNIYILVCFLKKIK